MQFKFSQRAMVTAARLFAALLVFGVAACAAPPPPPPPQAAVPADPVLAFVAAGRPGQSAVVNDPAMNGSVTVVIGTEYNSAAGDICRTYSTTSSSVQAQHLACGTGAQWHVVPPLVASSY